jgi:hypothetical protein
VSEGSQEKISMSLTKRLTGYHEAGHAVRAHFIRRESLTLGLATFTPREDGGWEGSIPVNLQEIHAEQHVDVALAGLFAEARRSGMDHAAAGGVAFLPNVQPELAEMLLSYYELDRTPESIQQLEHTPIRARRATGEPLQVVAGVSFEDLDEIPKADQTIERLEGAFGRLSLFFNADAHWNRVAWLADDLNDRELPQHFDYISLVQAAHLLQ